MQFEINNQILFNNDWQNVLPKLDDNSVDLLVADPPYGITDFKWDRKVDWEVFWKEAHRICKPTAIMALFASGKFMPELMNSNLKNYRYALIWEKNMATGHLHANRRPLRAHEDLLIFSERWGGSTYNPQKIEGKPHKIGGTKLGATMGHYAKPRLIADVKTNLYHPRSVLKYSNVAKGKSLHPTAKPLELVDWIVRSYSNEGDIVLDPFSGSGTTLAACLLSGRYGRGIEISRHYYKLSSRRLIEAEAVRLNV
jgi:DNA modification methylase